MLWHHPPEPLCSPPQARGLACGSRPAPPRREPAPPPTHGLGGADPARPCAQRPRAGGGGPPVLGSRRQLTGRHLVRHLQAAPRGAGVVGSAACRAGRCRRRPATRRRPGLGVRPAAAAGSTALRGRQARPLGSLRAVGRGPPGARARRRPPRWPSRWSRAASTACSTRICRIWCAASATTRRTR